MARTRITADDLEEFQPLAFDRYLVPPGMDKTIKATSHHTMKGFRYYCIPRDMEQRVSASIIKAYLNHEPLFLCEHRPAVGKFRYYLDIDSKGEGSENFDISAFMDRFVNILKSALTPSVKSFYEPYGNEEWKELALPVAKLADWGVKLPQGQQWDRYMSIVLQARKEDPHMGVTCTYHVVFPFLMVTPEEYTAINQKINELADPPLQFVDHPLTLRAPYCDKYGAGQAAERPFVFRNLPEYNHCYADDTRWMRRYLRSIWALSSLRWPLYVADKAPEALRPTPIMPQLDPDATTHVWRRSRCFYDPMTLHALIQACGDMESEVRQDAVVDYMNTCFAYLECSSPPMYIAKMPNGNSKKPKLDFICKKALEAFAGIRVKCVTMTTDTDPDGNERNRKHATSKLASTIWCESPRRRSVYELAYRPKMTLPNKILNTYPGRQFTKADLFQSFEYAHRGFNITKFLEHILNVWCAGIFDHFRYVLAWMASVYKQPGIGLGTSLVLIGPEGCGKSTPARPLGLLLGDSFWETGQPQDVLGRFSGHLFGTSFILCNELDNLPPSEAAVLRGLVTDDAKRFEWKGLPTILDKDHPFNFVFTSNSVNKSIFSVTPQARRWVMLNCKTGHRVLCPAYFSAMSEWLGHGKNTDKKMLGVKAFGALLHKMDISSYDSRVIPLTDILREQKLSSMPPEHQFIKEALDTGRFVALNADALGSPQYDAVFWPQLERFTPKVADLHSWYLDWCNKRKFNRPSGVPTFCCSIRTAIPSCFTFKSNTIRDQEDYFIMPGLIDAQQEFYNLYTGVAITDQFQGDIENLAALPEQREKPWIVINPSFTRKLYDGKPLYAFTEAEAFLL
jgi:hypothetical protein